MNTIDIDEVWDLVEREAARAATLYDERIGELAERRARLEEEERTLLERRKALDEFRDRIGRYRNDGLVPDRVITPESPFMEILAVQRMKGPEIVSLAAEILRETQGPLTRRRIAELIEERRGPTYSRDLAGHLGNLMWRDKETFVSFGKRGYGLVEWSAENDTAERLQVA